MNTRPLVTKRFFQMVYVTWSTVGPELVARTVREHVAVFTASTACAASPAPAATGQMYYSGSHHACITFDGIPDYQAAPGKTLLPHPTRLGGSLQYPF